MRFFTVSTFAWALAAAAADCDAEGCGAGDDGLGLLQVREVNAPHGGAAHGSKDHSEEDESLAAAPRTAGGEPAVPHCGLGFAVFPYGFAEARRWGTNFDGWQMCAGKAQSPIDIRSFPGWKRNNRVSGPALQVNYSTNAEPLMMANNGHGLGIDGHWGSLTVPDVGSFETANLHFHHPSEHTINGRPAEMEMHIVNVVPETGHYHGVFGGEAALAPPGTIAVVGILIDVGPHDNPCLAELFSKPQPIAGCQASVADFDLGRCFQHELAGDFWTYNGSLTTPGCTEGLYWHVMQRRATISKAQLEIFKERYLLNARPTQRLNGRVVTEHVVSG